MEDLCFYTYIHIHMYIYIHICVCAYVRTYMHMHSLTIHTHTHIHPYKHTYVPLHVRTYTYTYAHVHMFSFPLTIKVQPIIKTSTQNPRSCPLLCRASFHSATVALHAFYGDVVDLFSSQPPQIPGALLLTSIPSDLSP